MKKNTKNNRRSCTGKLKGLPIGLIVLLVASFLVAGAYLTYFVKVDSDVSVDSLLTCNGSPAEELDLTFDIVNACPGNYYYSENYTFALNANADFFTVIDINWSSDPEVTCGVCYYGNSTNITKIWLDPGESKTVTLIYGVDYDATAGSYSATFNFKNGYRVA